MRDKALTHHLEFLVTQTGEDVAVVLAQALRTGIEALYEEALTEAYLVGSVPRATVLQELGPERLASIEYQRDSLRRDIEWGLKGA
jgi:transcription initiation factor IIE alpha subunit